MTCQYCDEPATACITLRLYASDPLHYDDRESRHACPKHFTACWKALSEQAAGLGEKFMFFVEPVDTRTLASNDG